MKVTYLLALLTCALMTIGVGCSSSTASSANIDPQADAVLRSMSKTLSQARQLSLHVRDSMDEELDTGDIVRISNDRRVCVQRPNKLAVEAKGNLYNRKVWYNGRTLTVLSKDENIYGTVEAPNSIDKMFDFAMAEYDISIPLADLLFRKPYEILIANVYTGTYVGLEKIADRDCHHLAFQQELIDWQIWIDLSLIHI